MGELKHKNCGIKEVDEGQIFIIKVYCNRADFSSVSLLSEWWTIRAEAGNVSFLISLLGKFDLHQLAQHQIIFIIIQCSIKKL